MSKKLQLAVSLTVRNSKLAEVSKTIERSKHKICAVCRGCAFGEPSCPWTGCLCQARCGLFTIVCPHNSAINMSKRVPKALVPRKRVDDTLWDWVLTEVTDASQISDDHILSTYGFASRNAVFKPICHNKYSGLSTNSSEPMGPDSRSSNSHHVAASGSNEMHVKVEYGDDADSKPLASCSKKSCLSNPNCLNYLGQQRYEDEGITSVSRPAWSYV